MCSTLQHASQQFDSIFNSAAAAKRDAHNMWHAVSLAQHGPAKVSVASPVHAVAPPHINAAASPSLMSPVPASSPDSTSSPTAFMRRIKTDSKSTSADEARLSSSLAGSPHNYRQRAAGAMQPPSTSFADKFVRRERQNQGGGSKLSALRRMSSDSPTLAPLHMDSPMLTYQVSNRFIVFIRRYLL
jgi:hypothetical protein